MKLYLVQDKQTGLYLKWGWIRRTWVATQDEADLYRSCEDAAFTTIVCKLDGIDCRSVKIDIDALQILRDLNDTYNLGDIVYEIREKELKGWDGPLVTKWSDACRRAEVLLRDK